MWGPDFEAKRQKFLRYCPFKAEWNLWIHSPTPPHRNMVLIHSRASYYTRVYTLQLCNITGFEAIQSLRWFKLYKFFMWKYLYHFTFKNSGVWNDTIALPIQNCLARTCIASPVKILEFEMIQSLWRFKFFGVKVLVLLQLCIFRDLKWYNHFADSNLLHKSSCIALLLKTFGIWSNTIALQY